MTSRRDIAPARDWRVFLLIVSVSAVVAYGYFTRVDWPNVERRIVLHHQIVTGTAPSPYRYRVLVPVTIDVLARAASAVLPARASFLFLYALYDFAAIVAVLTTLFTWLRTWFDRSQALVGVLFVAATMPIALQDHYFQPWSLLDAALFTAALITIQRTRYLLLLGLTLVSALNRETAVFIPLALLTTIDVKGFVTSRGRVERAPMAVVCAGILLWAIVFLGLRFVLSAASGVDPMDLLISNLSATSLMTTLLNVSLFLGGFWWFAWSGFRHAPRVIKRLTLILPIYLAVVVFWGVWYEVRLLMPLYPILVPLGLSGLYPRDQGTAADSLEPVSSNARGSRT